MKHYHAPTMTGLYDNMVEGLLHGSPEDLEYITSVDVHQFDVIGEADSMVWDFDLKSAWLTKSRWSMMVRQYIEPEDLEAWIGRVTSKIGTKERGIANFRTKVVKPRGGAATGHTNKETRSWGSCMLNFSYRAIPQPTITMVSRTSYLGYIGALDFSVAYMVGKYLAQEMGIKLEQMKFIWSTQSIQWHNFKSLAFMLNHVDPVKREHYRRLLITPSKDLSVAEKREIIDHPAIRMSRKWLQKIVTDDNNGRTYGDLTYNTFRRIIRRYHTEVYGEEYAEQFAGWSFYKNGPKQGEQKEFFKPYRLLPSVKVDSLDFSPIGMPITRKYGEAFVGGGEEDDDDGDD